MLKLRGAFFNISDKPVSVEKIFSSGTRFIEMRLMDTNGNQIYSEIVSALIQDILVPRELNEFNGDFYLPPHFGLPFYIQFEQPESSDVSLSVRSTNQLEATGDPVLIPFGEDAEVGSYIGQDAEIVDSNEPFYQDSVRFGYRGVNYQAGQNGDMFWMYFDVTNNTGHQMFGVQDAARLLVYTKGKKGKKVYYGDMHLRGDNRYMIDDVIDPGETKNLPIEFSYEYFSQRGQTDALDNQQELEGGVALLMIGSRWAAFRLPEFESIE